MKNELKRNKVATTNQLGYVIKPRYSVNAPYDRWSSLYGNNDKAPQEYYITPIPDYVDVTYDFIAWTEYQNQLNFLVEQFVYFTGQSFGETNSLKFATNTDSFTMEDNNTTGQDRLIRSSFQITVHGYLLPRVAGNQITTKRVVSMNKVTFGQEAFSNINVQNRNQFRNVNYDSTDQAEDLRRRLNDFEDISLNRSADVYPTENE